MPMICITLKMFIRIKESVTLVLVNELVMWLVLLTNLLFIVCDVGFYDNSGTCLPCEKGKYSSEPNQTLCSVCDFQKTTVGTGTTSIDLCGGFFVN